VSINFHLLIVGGLSLAIAHWFCQRTAGGQRRFWFWFAYAALSVQGAWLMVSPLVRWAAGK
jgi:hypothetical protein